MTLPVGRDMHSWFVGSSTMDSEGTKKSQDANGGVAQQ